MLPSSSTKQQHTTVLIVFISIFCVTKAALQTSKPGTQCKNVLSAELRSEIQNYSVIAKTIIEELTAGTEANSTYKYLQEFIDKFGSRFTSTQNLENAIDFMLQQSIDEGLTAHTENVTVPQWVRGKEHATLIEPRVQNLNMLGLGYSVGTPPEGITAEVVVFKDFDEMEANKDLVKGKIVVFNEEWVGYGKTVIYRSKSASRASRHGAVAALVRSVTPFSINTPHTGMQTYDADVPRKIPVACITVEDAKLLHRLYQKGENLTIRLYMEAENRAPKMSRNLVIDVPGSQKPNSYVLISGHLDSWDVGAGAMDDGGGAFISWNTARVLKKLKLKPRRTVRAVLWTGEEMGLVGSTSYFNDHKEDIDNYNLVMESDIGTFRPYGVSYYGKDFGYCVFEEIMKHLTRIKVTELTRDNDVGPDVNVWVDHGVPGATISQQNNRYFWYHHTDADRLEIEDPSDLNYCTAVWAVVSYIVADLSEDLPKDVTL